MKAEPLYLECESVVKNVETIHFRHFKLSFHHVVQMMLLALGHISKAVLLALALIWVLSFKKT